MKNEEIQIILESILASLEELKKNSRIKIETEPNPEETESLLKKIEFNQKISEKLIDTNIKLKDMIVAESKNIASQKSLEIIKMAITKLSFYIQEINKKEIINRHYFLFLPDLRKWFILVKRSYVILILSLIILVGSFLYSKQTINQKLQEPLAEKYRIMRAYSNSYHLYYSNIQKYIKDLDNLPELKRKEMIKRAIEIEDSISTIIQRKNKINYHKSQLNKLKEEQNDSNDN